MIEIIYDANSLEGSCYIEVLPSKYKGACWNADSIFFTEENFGYILPAFEKCYKKFNYFAFNEIDIDTWSLIIRELESVKQFLATDPELNSLNGVLGFPFNYSESEFKEDYEVNKKQLISMITDFQFWISEKVHSTKFISVLGM